MRKHIGLGLLAATLFVAACGDDGGTSTTDGPDLFQPNPECEGADIVPFQGGHHQVISQLAIGAKTDGFDLDGDGDPDNSLSAVASLAQESIDESIAEYDILIPLELFDVESAADDTCVKFAIYVGEYAEDQDADGSRPGVENGDCNDTAAGASIRRGMPEIAGNGIDENCDGRADEDVDGNASTSTADTDGDGFTIAEGDCNDSVATIKPDAAEVCGNGLDEDCDGVADRSVDGAGMVTACSPYEPGAADIALDPLSFKPGTMDPFITFVDGTFAGGKVKAGPSLFSVAIPVTDDLTLDLRITGATIEADVVMEAGKVVFKNTRLGGVIDGVTADTIRGLELEEIGLTPENSLLDATFANLLGPLLALPKSSMEIQDMYPGCRTPDIDVDGDGLESFCDSNVDDDIKNVDVCIDGDGTEIRDMGATQCSTAQKDGVDRFKDGISVALTFSTTAINSILPPGQ